MRIVLSWMRVLPLVGLVLSISCSSSDEDSQNSLGERTFLMGFTPWPYAATTTAVNAVYSTINSNGDLIAHHIDDGIPYTASDILDFTTYSDNIKNEFNGRINSTAAGKTIYLALNSLNSDRSDIANLWDNSSNMARPAPWNARSFDSAEFISAYINFATAIIYKFKTDYGAEPSYFNYAIEVSELMINQPTRFAKFITFAHDVYATMKPQHPDMKFVVSLALKEPGSADMDTVAAGFAQIKDYVDMAGISTYGYAFYNHSDAGNPDALPLDWLAQIKTIAPNKAYGVTETGWIAENLKIDAYGLDVSSTEEKQNRYLEKLFSECNNDLSAEIVVWFSAYDYDTLWTDTLGEDNLAKIWKDTGLISETFVQRTAFSTWKQWFERTLQ